MKIIRLVSLVWLISIFLAALNNNGFASDKYNFRQTKWGMSKEEVKKKENGEPDQSFSKGDILAYHSEIFNEKVLVLYKFSFNKLIWGKYILSRYLFEKGKVIAPTPIADFDKFEKILSNKYGKPKKTGVKLSKETHNKYEELEKIGNQIKLLDFMDETIRKGKADWYSAWETKNTLILLHLHGGMGKIIFEISYADIKNRKVIDEDLI